MKSDNTELGWFDRPGVRKGLWVALLVGCVLSLLAEVGYRMFSHDSHMEGKPLKYAIIGLVSCAVMVIITKGLGTWLKVSPNYYQEHDPELPDE